MRGSILLLLAATSALAFADREITVPKGRRLATGEYRLEALGVPGDRTLRAWAGTGVLESFDFEFTNTRTTTRDSVTSLDLSYNFLPPIIDVSPGISLGVQDSFNRTEGGRAAYLAATLRFGNDGIFNQDVPTDITVGIWTKSAGALFFGARLPFSESIVLLAEHNSERLAAGFEAKPVRGLSFKVVFESGATHFGLSLGRKF